MKKVMTVFAALMLTLSWGLPAPVYAKDLVIEKKAGDYSVEVKIDKNPPIAGENGIEVEIKDASGKYVTDAKVVIEYSMPAMPGMPPMNYKTEAGLKGYEYKAEMNLSMRGQWNIAVKITRLGKTETAKFNIDAH